MDARYGADTKIANSNREFQMRKADFDQEVNTKKAEAELAYQLQVRITPLIYTINAAACACFLSQVYFSFLFWFMIYIFFTERINIYLTSLARHFPGHLGHFLIY